MAKKLTINPRDLIEALTCGDDSYDYGWFLDKSNGDVILAGDGCDVSLARAMTIPIIWLSNRCPRMTLIRSWRISSMNWATRTLPPRYAAPWTAGNRSAASRTPCLTTRKPRRLVHF